ncbi:MAG: glycosyltransferase [Gemmatimonadota bacterium]|nr:MAG: glycosyltransferase [Gemmatimonadota bacterium]
MNNETPFVSIIVAARNEDRHIEHCVTALIDQDYPQQRYEIIVVDDRSHDRTPEIVNTMLERSKNLRLFHVGTEPSPLVGKKRALDLGIRQSRGEIILTTDADCLPKSTWIGGMIKYFEPSVGLVAGYTYTEEPGERVTVLQRLRSVERISVAAVAAGSIGWGQGLTCTGQNLAYRKKVYYDVGGFSKIGHVRSGDDDLLIQRVHRKTSWQTRYAVSSETYVRTKPPSGARPYIQQEKRRASKGFLYPPWLTLSLLALYSFYILLFVSLWISFFDWNHFSIAWYVLGAKAFGEFPLLVKICTLLNRKDLVVLFPVAEIVHIPYLIIFGLWGTLCTYSWKE